MNVLGSNIELYVFVLMMLNYIVRYYMFWIKARIIVFFLIDYFGEWVGFIEDRVEEAVIFIFYINFLFFLYFIDIGLVVFIISFMIILGEYFF